MLIHFYDDDILARMKRIKKYTREYIKRKQDRFLYIYFNKFFLFLCFCLGVLLFVIQSLQAVGLNCIQAECRLSSNWREWNVLGNIGRVDASQEGGMMR